MKKIFFRDAIKEAAQEHQLAIHAYVWMTNHIHLLATPKREDSIAKVFQSAGRRYVQYFNLTYQRTGTLWDGRYRAAPVEGERYLLTVMRYIELNPVRAAIVDHPREYRWSSFAFNGDGVKSVQTSWLKQHVEYEKLARNAEDRSAAYRALFRGSIRTQDLNEIRDATHKGWVLGSEQFKAITEKCSRRQVSSKGVGRPRVTDTGSRKTRV